LIEELLVNNGIKAYRRGQPNQEDILIEGIGTLEAKCWRAGLKTLYKMKGDKDFLAVKLQSLQDKNKQILIIMDIDKFIELCQAKLKQS